MALLDGLKNFGGLREAAVDLVGRRNVGQAENALGGMNAGFGAQQDGKDYNVPGWAGGEYTIDGQTGDVKASPEQANGSILNAAPVGAGQITFSKEQIEYAKMVLKEDYDVALDPKLEMTARESTRQDLAAAASVQPEIAASAVQAESSLANVSAKELMETFSADMSPSSQNIAAMFADVQLNNQSLPEFIQSALDNKEFANIDMAALMEEARANPANAEIFANIDDLKDRAASGNDPQATKDLELFQKETAQMMEKVQEQIAQMPGVSAAPAVGGATASADGTDVSDAFEKLLGGDFAKSMGGEMAGFIEVFAAIMKIFSEGGLEQGEDVSVASAVAPAASPTVAASVAPEMPVAENEGLSPDMTKALADVDATVSVNWDTGEIDGPSAVQEKIERGELLTPKEAQIAAAIQNQAGIMDLSVQAQMDEQQAAQAAQDSGIMKDAPVETIAAAGSIPVPQELPKLKGLDTLMESITGVTQVDIHKAGNVAGIEVDVSDKVLDQNDIVFTPVAVDPEIASRGESAGRA